MAKNKRQNQPTPPSKKTNQNPHPAPVDWIQMACQFGIFILVASIFSVARGNDFVAWDDHIYVFENQYILNPTWAGFKQFGTSVVSLNYHPLTMWSLWLNAKLFGSGPSSFIWTNVIIHAINAVLAYRLAWYISGKSTAIALVTALLFAVHPLRVESVVWVSERKDVLYVWFFFLSCLSYWRFLENGLKKWFWISLIWFVLACLSKATAVVLPIVLLLLDYWKKRDLKLNILIEKLPFWAISLCFGLIAVSVQAGGDFHGLLTVPAGTRDVALSQSTDSFFEKMRFAGYGFWQYWQTFFLPSGLCTFYPYPDPESAKSNLLFSIGPLFLLVNLALIIYYWAKKTLVSFSLAFFLVTVVLVLQFLQVGLVIRADRYTYLPHWGLAFLIAYGVHHGIEAYNKNFLKIWWAVAAVFIVWMGIKTTEQIGTWRNAESLWNTVLAQYPKEDMPRETLSNWYGRNNRIKEATTQLEMAISDGCDRPRVYSTLANCYAIEANTPGKDTTGRAAQFSKINELYGKAIALEPDNGVHYLDRAATFYAMNPTQSLEDIKKAEPLVSTDKEINLHTLKGMCLINLKNYAAAKTELDAVIKLCEQIPASKRSVPVTQQMGTAYRNRGIARFYLSDQPGALADLQKSLQIVPNDPVTLNVIRQIENQPIKK